MQPEKHKTPLALRHLAGLLGREEPLHALHGALRRAVHAVGPVVESGACLVTCSDEFNGELRAAFDRDVARWLTAPGIPWHRRLFVQANMGGRIEPGAIALADQHFTTLSRKSGKKLLVLLVASHVGHRQVSGSHVWGELDRFGKPSPCCGALNLLLEAPGSTAAVRFPWFDQLTAFFGPERLAALRTDRGPWRMLRIAAVHAVLQAESAMTDLLREPPETPTHVLLVPLVAVNRKGQDSAVVVGLHHFEFERGAAHIGLGTSLRSTPSSLDFREERGRVLVESPHDEAAEPAPRLAPAPGAKLSPELLRRAQSDEVRGHVELSRTQLRRLKDAHPHAVRVYSRPLLRAFLQGLSMLAPEVGLAALAIQGGHGLLRASRRERLLAHGPSSEEARAVLHDLEPELQQLGHREAGEVLEILLAEHGPLSG